MLLALLGMIHTDANSSLCRRHHRRIGNRAFSVAAPRAWNRLQTELKPLRSTDSFRSDLQTFLFHCVYEHRIRIDSVIRGAITAGKLSGTKVWVPTPGPAHGQRPGWVLGAGGDRPPPAVRVLGYHPPPGKFWKTQMLNPAFW